MVKLLSILSLILALVLFPPAVLAVISNNAIPGDSTYPIKRTLEDIIFTMASINPTTKAWFSAARSDRRFKELTVLITQGKQAGETLNELVEQTSIAANQITQISDQSQKVKLVEQLSASIEKYDQSLQQLTNKDDTPNPPDSTPTQTSLPKATNLPTITSTTPRGVVSPTIPPQTALTPTPTTTPTLAPVPLPQSPTPTVQPTPSPRRENEEGRQRHEEREFPSEIEEARKKLEEIKKKLRHESRGENREKSEKQENEHDEDSSKEDKSSESNKRGNSSERN